MKHGKSATLKQKAIISKNKMDSDEWLVSKVLPDRLLCINKYSGETKPAFLNVIKI